MTPAISFQGINKVYSHLAGQEVPALTEVSFEVGAGEVCAFLGPNGAGKTTSINLLMGFHYPDGGDIRVLGFEAGDVRAKRQIGFLPENFAFHKHLNAVELLQFHLSLSGPAHSASPSLIRDLIAKVRLNGFEKLKIGKYSRGMLQRLGIAQALLNDPQLLILDEPTSGLDPAGRLDVRSLIRDLKLAGRTIFLSSHILSEVEKVCDRAIIINRGRVIRSGSLPELLGAVDQVEIVADQLPLDFEPLLALWAASFQRLPSEVRITVPSAHKRELIEKLWAAGCDVLNMNTGSGSLEDLYMRLVGNGNQP